jgi:DNA-binding XRE family transcriptional regulator
VGIPHDKIVDGDEPEWNRGTVAPKPDKPWIRNFCEATKRARGNAGFTTQQMAIKLGLPHKTYLNYETRSPLALHLILRFCVHTGITIADLFDQANNPPP